MARSKIKPLSFLSVFLLGVDGIVGSGIFLMPSRVYAKVGDLSAGLMMLAGISVLMIALCFANLPAKFLGMVALGCTLTRPLVALPDLKLVFLRGYWVLLPWPQKYRPL